MFMISGYPAKDQAHQALEPAEMVPSGEGVRFFSVFDPAPNGRFLACRVRKN